MTLIAGSLIAGLGLFYFGLRFLTEHLKFLSSRRLRERIANWTRNSFLGLAWGVVFIGVTQSSSAAMFILVGMIRSGLIAVRQAQPIIIGINIGAPFVVMVLAIDLEAAILFVLGISAILYVSDRKLHIRATCGVLFGIALLFFGLETMHQAVAPLAETPWFEHILELARESYLEAFIIGAALSFAVQSSVAIVVLTIPLQQAGLFSLSESIMVVYGANVGASLLALLLSSNLVGQAKQIAMYQTFYNFAGALILVPLFYLEVFTGVPLVRAATEAVSTHSGLQIATVYLIFNTVPGLFLFLAVGPTASLLARIWPETAVDVASKPHYLHSAIARDPHGAIHLVEMEQARLLELLSTSLNAMSGETGEARPTGNHDAFETVSALVQETIGQLSTESLSDIDLRRLDHLFLIQSSLSTVNDELRAMGDGFEKLRGSETGARFADAVVDELTTVFALLSKIARIGDKEDAARLSARTSTDDNAVRALRAKFLVDEDAMEGVERMELLDGAGHGERLIWLLGKLGGDYMALNET